MSMFPSVFGRENGVLNSGVRQAESHPARFQMSRRGIFGVVAGVAATAILPATASAASSQIKSVATGMSGKPRMSSGFVKTADGTEIYFKDWGPKDAQPIHFHHGWPLSADDWDTQLLFFLANGYRVVAHDRRGHGRSTQVDTGNTMDRYAADASAVVEHLDLRNVVHIGHSTGGGEVARYVARYGQPQGRVAKAVLVSSVPPLMLKTASNPEGTPLSVFDGFREALAANRSQFYLDVASGPFYGFNRPGAKVSQGVILNWWRQGMMGGAIAQYQGIKAFSETDQTDDLKAITVPTLVLQGDDDQVVPYKDAALLQAKLIRNSTLKIYPGFPHGMLTTHAEVINPDLLAFVKA
ncbi:Pimeloyl-ACP methyl ester carboxylesterase [Pseudoxanthobacter soli DSM 19599]|uniref:Pimeloyl-ACP methyl ester carboxylesterase n=2 Tax=Pseudoxanthobacter TaxID=433838 RepID=A0A1M7ZP29_9HYPH|nr:Pimeloyl-ACP methyl ester carboxylesterase [Pseudoxanthobacter soli DSM 19599]